MDTLTEVPVTENLLSYKEKIENYGYLCMNESSNRISFNKGYTENGFARKVFHLHLRYCADNAEYNYELYFHWYNLIHELGHIIIMFNSVSHPHPAEEEQLVNNFAVAYWQHYGEQEKINELKSIVHNTINKFIVPTHENINYMHYAKEKWGHEELNNFNNYGWFQFSSVKNAISSNQSLEDALSDMSSLRIQSQKKETFLFKSQSNF